MGADRPAKGSARTEYFMKIFEGAASAEPTPVKQQKIHCSGFWRPVVRIGHKTPSRFHRAGK
jgi:hypothetical protein